MKTGIMAVLKWGATLVSIFAPFLLVLSVVFMHPNIERIYLEANFRDDMSWIWLMALAAMILGIYYLTAYMTFTAFKRARLTR